MAKDAARGVDFLSRLVDPYDADDSPPGGAAWDDVGDVGKGLLDYVGKAISNPKTVADDVGARLHDLQVRTDPGITPPARTLADEAARNFNVGLNQGELAFDVGSLFSGIGEAKGMALLRKLPEEGAAKSLAQGVSPELSAYFEEPYDGMGHHIVARRTRLPSVLGGGPVPPAISNSPFFLLKPQGMTKGDFSKLHYGVDPRFHGGRVSNEFGGGGWSGKKLGWKKYGPPGRAWHGSTPGLKAVAGGGLLGVGAGVDQISEGEH